MNRRNFLKLGAVSSVTLGAVGVTASLSSCSDNSTDGQWKVLRKDDRTMLRAIAPVMMYGNLPSEKPKEKAAIETMLTYMDIAIHNLGPHNTKQMKDLFNLLNFRISRGLTTGIWSNWENASTEDIEHFLTSWRNSSLSLFNLAYNGLNKLMCTTLYGQPISWKQTGYPGPPYADILITKEPS